MGVMSLEADKMGNLMTASTYLRRILTVAVVVCTSLTFVAFLTDTARAADYNLFHFNICGNVCEEGDDTTDDPNDVVEALRKSLTEGVTEIAASLNEVCKNQFNKLMNLLPSAWNGEFVTTKRPSSSSTDSLCYENGSEHEYGNAILVKAPIVAGSVVIASLPKATDETRRIVCVTANLPTDLRFCSTHIAPLGTWSTDPHTKQKEQITAVRQIVNGFNHPVVLMGDFNTEPPSDKLDQIYHTTFGGNATGKFREADQDTPSYGGTTIPCRCGAPTHSNGKIDFIFFTVHFAQISGGPSPATTDSDHEILRGKVQI